MASLVSCRRAALRARGINYQRPNERSSMPAMAHAVAGGTIGVPHRDSMEHSQLVFGDAVVGHSHNGFGRDAEPLENVCRLT